MQSKTKFIRTAFIFCFAMCFCFQNLYSQIISDKKILYILYQTKDTGINIQDFKLKNTFESIAQAHLYINNVTKFFNLKGFAACSVDSVWQSSDTINVEIFFGKQYKLVNVKTTGIEKNILYKAGIDKTDLTNKLLNLEQINIIKEKILNVYENNGFPFATIYFDSINIQNEQVQAILKADNLIPYVIDSITNRGNLKLNSKFIQRYLGISNNSPYMLSKLLQVDKKIAELAYAQILSPSYLQMLGSGATLKLNVGTKKSSEASAIIGFLPDANNTGKYAFTGDINFDFKNLFGAGEGLLLKYQSLQPKSPRLNIGVEKPYLFNTPYGINFLFDFFKKDSSFYQLNSQFGIYLNLPNNQATKVFVQFQNTTLLPSGADTARVKLLKKLPNIIDVKATNVGFTYEFKNTNYKYNPIRGYDILASALVGIKNTKENSIITSLFDPIFNFKSLYDSINLKSYQFRLKIIATRYLKIAKAATIKSSIQTGIYSSPNIFRNDVFQIGGNKLLRGFDEESIYASSYAVATVEARSLVSTNSYLFGFVDVGFTKTNFFNVNQKNNFIGTGIGIVYETKAGILNLSLAAGKRNDLPFNLRQAAKIHFGYINYF